MGSNRQTIWDAKEIDLNTVAVGSAKIVASKIDGSREQGCKLHSLRAGVNVFAESTARGPLYWGYSIDMSVADIIAAFAADPQGQKDVELMMEANRKMVVLGQIPYTDADNSQDYEFKPRVCPSWEVLEGSTINWFVHVPTQGVEVNAGTFEVLARWATEWLED